MGKRVKNTKAARGSRRHLALNVRVARALFGLSQEALGLHCGLKRTYIGSVERAEINPGIDNLDRIARGLGVPAHVLLLQPDVAQPLIYRQVDGHMLRRGRNKDSTPYEG
jgi:transcriptional regulator with XRE-family HTH domain